jgi:hypothetical protein
MVSFFLITAPFEKSLQIVLVRDVDGKTFWDALDDAISPRIKAPTAIDESALSTFRSIFQGRSLKKGTFIFLSWLDPSKMLVSLTYICNIFFHRTPPPPPSPPGGLAPAKFSTHSFTWFYSVFVSVI